MKWLDRRVAHPGPYLALCLSEADYLKAMRRLKVKSPEEWVRPGQASATAHFVDGDGGLCVVVCIKDYQGRNPIEVAGLLVHEAVHVWQAYAESIGETKPGSEQEAYAIQGISQTLMQSFADQITQKKP